MRLRNVWKMGVLIFFDKKFRTFVDGKKFNEIYHYGDGYRKCRHNLQCIIPLSFNEIAISIFDFKLYTKATIFEKRIMYFCCVYLFSSLVSGRQKNWTN